MPLSRIKQTSKTIIFEEFCVKDEVKDLNTLLRNENIDNKDEFMKLIETDLEVRSFEEFLEKFTPSVWEWYEQTNDPDMPIKPCYSLEKPTHVNGQAHELKLTDNEFYKMVMDLYSKKGISGESNLEFDYSAVAELLSPKQVYENAKQYRKDIKYNFEKLKKLQDASRSEKNECIKKINTLRKKIVQQYKDSFTGTIKLALADTENKLAALESPNNKSEVSSEESKPNMTLPCKVKFDDDGELEVVPIVVDSIPETDEIENDNKQELVALISNDFDKYGNNAGNYVKSIVVDSYVGGTQLVQQLDKEELIKKKNELSKIYSYSQEKFIRTISSAIEKILDVKAFFEQASIDGEKLPAPVIITNCKASKLIESESTKKKFSKLIREMGNELDRPWFAIIPAIGDRDFIDNIEENLSLDDLDFMDDSDTDSGNINTSDGDSLISIQAVNQVIDILKDGKITTFFNFRANEKTGFANLSNDVINMYRDKVKGNGIDSNEYAVFAYPNFTVLPKKETSIKIGNEKVDILGIYIDAAYVAAGLVVASQNPEYLSKKNFNINKNNPCVRFDLEEGENRFIMTTKMNREGKGMWSLDVEDNITKDMFGFCFCGNAKFYNDNLINNTYVFCARNMAKDKEGYYKPIYTRLTMDFIMLYLNTYNLGMGRDKIKKSVIDNFIEDKVGDWKRIAESENYTNNILHENEDVYLDEDNKLHMKFKKDSELIPLSIEED